MSRVTLKLSSFFDKLIAEHHQSVAGLPLCEMLQLCKVIRVITGDVFVLISPLLCNLFPHQSVWESLRQCVSAVWPEGPLPALHFAYNNNQHVFPFSVPNPNVAKRVINRSLYVFIIFNSLVFFEDVFAKRKSANLRFPTAAKRAAAAGEALILIESTLIQAFPFGLCEPLSR